MTKRKPYFGKDVEMAIYQYCQSEDRRQRDQIFKDHIYHALNKLSENVIRNKNLHNFGNDIYEDVKHECIIHLLERLDKFNPIKGHKAFSYFNRVAINWVWAKMSEVGRETYGRTEIVEIDNKRDLDNEFYLQDYHSELRDFCQRWSKWGIDHLDYFFFIKNGKIVPFTKKERQIANAVFNLFENSHSIDIYNKKALYILIREQVDTKTQSITDVVNVLRPLCKEMYFDFKVNGQRYWHRFLYYPDEIEMEDNYNEEKCINYEME